MKKLFEETYIKDMALKNRFIKAAVWEALATEDGHLTDDLLAIYEDLAKGGIGTIITGYTYVHKDEQPNPNMMGMYDDRFIDEYKTLVDLVHSHGSNIILQLVYGGSLENRARLLIKLVKAVRHEVGENYPILIKINSDDYMTSGLTSEESIEVSKMLETAGVDAIEVSGGNESTKTVLEKNLGPARRKVAQSKANESYFKDHAKRLAQAVSIPVILTGGNRHISVMQEILSLTGVEYFALGRPMIAESDLVNQWSKDMAHSPKCVSCNGCYHTPGKRCVLNLT